MPAVHPIGLYLNRIYDVIASDRPIDIVVKELRPLIGAEHITYTSAASSIDPTITPYIKTTYSPEWLKRYMDMSYEKIDPVLKRAYGSTLPFQWSELKAEDAAVFLMMIDAARHGIGPNGLSIPVVAKSGRRGLFSLCSSAPHDVWQRYCSDNLNFIVDIANRIHKRVCSELDGESSLHLSNREIECLMWCARGKEAKQIAIILGLSVHTVRDFLKSARYKLDCTNLTQAVAKGIARGIISNPATE